MTNRFEAYKPKRAGVKGWDIPLETPAKLVRNNRVGCSIIVDNMRMNLETDSRFYSDEDLFGEVIFEGNLKEVYNFASNLYPAKIKKMA